jgi:ElaA protein
MSVTIREMKDGSDFAICMAIRMEVFVREQNVPIDVEMDDLDATATHYIATVDGAPSATARTRVENGVGYIERVAVRKEKRGTGVGRELMEHLIKRLRNHPQAKTIEISAQTYALPFYEKLGFVAEGDEYMDAGIPHKKMRLD